MELTKGPNDKEFIYNKKYMYMHYINSLEKIFLSLSIFFDYDEIGEMLKYILYIYLPYFTFGYYYRDFIIQKEFHNKKINISEKMNIDDMEQFLKDNNNKMLNYFKKFLKKFPLFILLTDYNNKNEHIINSFNELNLENLFCIIDKDNLYKLLPKNSDNEINFSDIINFIPKIFNENELFAKKFGKYLDHKTVLKKIFANITKHIPYIDKVNICKELILQFSPTKFSFINLDNKVFDFIENNLGKKCDICNKLSKFSFICLICGKKVCHINANNHAEIHFKKCEGNSGIFVDMESMKIILLNNDYYVKKKCFHYM